MLQKVWVRWKKFGRFMGNAIARVALSVFYFTVLVPFGLATGLFSDKLDLDISHQEYWKPRETPIDTIESARKQS